jgi:hypothetical protein
MAFRSTGTLDLSGGFTATAAGAVRLQGARVGGELDAADATISNDTRTASYADRSRSTAMFLTSRFSVAPGGHHVAMMLTDTRIGGLFVDLASIKDARDGNVWISTVSEAGHAP